MGAQDILASARSGHGGGQGRGSGGEGPLFLLVGTDYTVIAASDPQQIGRSLSEAERGQALALVVEGQTVGYLLREGAGAQALDQTQQKFLNDVSSVLALTTVGAIDPGAGHGVGSCLGPGPPAEPPAAVGSSHRAGPSRHSNASRRNHRISRSGSRLQPYVGGAG